MGVIGSSITPGAAREDGLEVVAARETTPRQLALRRFLRHRLAVISLVVILLMALAAALAPLIAPYHPVNPLLTVAPGVLLTVAILAVNFIGDGLRDALDPRGK